MTFTSRLLSWFPALHVLLLVATIFSAHSLFAFIFVLYFLPPLLFRLHNRIFPLKEGLSNLAKDQYSSWWGGHQLQVMYIAWPDVEALLRVIPGFYSAWLRLWGAQIGSGVYWTPGVQIMDRSLLMVGDNVIFGQGTQLCSHVVSRKRESIRLYVKKIEIGNGCLIGAESRLGPGITLPESTELPYATIKVGPGDLS